MGNITRRDERLDIIVKIEKKKWFCVGCKKVRIVETYWWLEKKTGAIVKFLKPEGMLLCKECKQQREQKEEDKDHIIKDKKIKISEEDEDHIVRDKKI